MTAVTENDLKRLEDLITNGIKTLENGQLEIKSDIKSLNGNPRSTKRPILPKK
jgi:hypothetical protein